MNFPEQSGYFRFQLVFVRSFFLKIEFVLTIVRTFLTNDFSQEMDSRTRGLPLLVLEDPLLQKKHIYLAESQD